MTTTTNDTSAAELARELREKIEHQPHVRGRVGYRAVSVEMIESAAARIESDAREIERLRNALSELVAEADEHPGWEGHAHSNSYGFQLARAALSAPKGDA